METDAVDFAMQKEQDAEELYRKLAQASPDRGLAGIMNMLADVEAKHYQILKALKESLDLAVMIEMDEDNYRGAFKTLFSDLNEQVAAFDFDMSQVEMYKTARQREDEAQRFYEEQAAKSEAGEAKGLFETLAAQEKLHFDILDSVIEFVSRPEPGQWLENAEWFHGEEY